MNIVICRLIMLTFVASILAQGNAFAICLQNQDKGSANTIVLRNLTLVENVVIDSMSVDGVVLAGGIRLPWSDILQGNVGEQQVEFDSAIRNIGLPLYRIRNRLGNRDTSQLQPMTDNLLEQVGNSSGQTAYIAYAASFHGLLEQGDRPGALKPLLKLLDLRSRNRTSPGNYDELDRELNLRFAEDGICLNLLPVWFEDLQKIELPIGDVNFEATNLATLVYLHSFDIKKRSHAKEKLEIVPDEQKFQIPDLPINDGNWKLILLAQSECINNSHAQSEPSDITSGSAFAELVNSRRNLNVAQRAIALYYQGLTLRNRALVVKTDQDNSGSQEWKLLLLQIPALYQELFPEISAAAIFHVLDQVPSGNDYDSLRKELSHRFSNTFFGRRFQ